ncbi:class I SAM-dependent methyltransferase [uncultured Enorma sp.]|uniref:class I SAM-dependent methyltransferase n=1 Tax=uncultured Enorma sp. TaxID=1714346 RepID=UPI002633F301|nr:class I SAM-dependent methyltransferase [uncultured Enorma sp.]
MNDRMDKQDAELLRARSRTAFDAQATTYDEGMQGEHARNLYPHVLAEVTRAVAGDPAPRLLDLGCGTGALGELVLSRLPGARLTCVDLSPRMVEAARMRLGDRADVLLCDAERLPFRDGSFDAAWCNDSFHHYPDPERAAFQAWRVLAPGGTFIIGDAWQPAPARAIMNAWMPYSREGDVRIYSEAELRRILGTWFSDVSWRRVGQTACIAVARKGV